jgi:hypothetical protein
MRYRRIYPITLGAAFGAIEGLSIFTVTVLLILRGESVPVLFTEFLPFYDLSMRGAFIGLAEGLIDGFVGGLVFAWVYNSGMRRIIGDGK